jgi:hypothetical protein
MIDKKKVMAKQLEATLEAHPLLGKIIFDHIDEDKLGVMSNEMRKQVIACVALAFALGYGYEDMKQAEREQRTN